MPFLKKRPDVAGLIIKTRAPDVQDNAPEQEEDPVEVCAQDLMDAVHARDPKRAAEALRAAFQILDGEPHHEGEHLDEGQDEEPEER